MPSWLKNIFKFFGKCFGALFGGVLYPLKMLLVSAGITIGISVLIVAAMVAIPLFAFYKIARETNLFIALLAIVPVTLVVVFFGVIGLDVISLASVVFTPVVAYYAFKEGVTTGWNRGLFHMLRGLFTRVVNGIDLDGQSTHRADVHAWSSASAKKLMAHYGDKVDSEFKIDQQLDDFALALDNMSPKGHENGPLQSAIRGLARLRTIHSVDAVSNVSIRQLLALCWIAVHDNDLRAEGCSLQEAQNFLIEGLYECQRGYNLDRHCRDKDINLPDIAICAPGSFNKMLEKLVGIHPHASQQEVTQQQACQKFSPVVIEELKDYLRRIEATEPERLADIVADIDRNGIHGEHWDEIKDRVRRRMFAEFGSLWQVAAAQDNDDDVHDVVVQTEHPGYAELINGIEDNITPDLSDFKKPVESDGMRIPPVVTGMFDTGRGFFKINKSDKEVKTLESSSDEDEYPGLSVHRA